MILKQIKKHLGEATYVEFHFHDKEVIIASEIGYEQSTEDFIKVLKPVPMIINSKNILYIEFPENNI